MPSESMFQECSYCGVEFEVWRSDQRYCSLKCGELGWTYVKSQRRAVEREQWAKRLCAYCGVEFEAAKGNQKFCSGKCRRLEGLYLLRQRNVVKREQGEKRLCVRCGKSFTLSQFGRSDQRFCSSRCRNAAAGVRNYVPLPQEPDRPCGYCGVVFTPRTGRKQKYCSKECKWKGGLAIKRDRVRTDPAYAILLRLRARLAYALRQASAKKSAKTLELVGCTLPELMAYLESKFLLGMTWENRELWHVDHIIPCVSFNLTDPEQQRLCFYYMNLQPLWGEDNLSKSDKVLVEGQVFCARNLSDYD